MRLTAKVIGISHAKFNFIAIDLQLYNIQGYANFITWDTCVHIKYIHTCMGKPYLTWVGHVCGLPLLPRMVNPPVAHSLYIQTVVIASRDGVHFHQFLQHAFRAVSGDRLPRLKAYATRCSAIAPKLKKGSRDQNHAASGGTFSCVASTCRCLSAYQI